MASRVLTLQFLHKGWCWVKGKVFPKRVSVKQRAVVSPTRLRQPLGYKYRSSKYSGIRCYPSPHTEISDPLDPTEERYQASVTAPADLEQKRAENTLGGKRKREEKKPSKKNSKEKAWPASSLGMRG